MSEDFGPTFITITDEDGTEIVLEFVDALEHNGQIYQAFFPAEVEGEDEDDPDRIDPEDPSTWYDKPYCCKACDGPYPDCVDSCSIIDD